MNESKRGLLIDILLKYRELIFVVTALLVVCGVLALVEMPRDEFPEFEIRQGLIVGIYPGASSEQVEAQLTQKVENFLFQFKAIDKLKTRSISRENVMIVYVEVRATETNTDAFWGKIKHGLVELKTELPAGVMSLTANDDFGNASAILMAVESETRSYRELENYIESFEDAVRRIPATSRVKHFGLQKEEINVYLDDAKLAHYGIKPLALYMAIKPQGDINYAGEIDDGKLIRPIHIPTDYLAANDIAEQIVFCDAEGHSVRVRDVARVVREYTKPVSHIRLNGKKSLVVSLEMLAGNNIVQYGEAVQTEIDLFMAQLPADVEVGVISNLPEFVSHSIFDFLKEFGTAIIAVILVTILLLPRRVALVAASSIPISIFITLGIMWAAGMTLQTVSLAGLIIVLGMVVDNAIVIVDAYMEKLDSGISRREAASQAVSEIFGSVFSATMVIIASFAPMIFFLTGLVGDFVRSLPATVAIALCTSLAVASILVPLLSYLFIKTGIKNSDDSKSGKSLLTVLQTSYNKGVEQAFRFKGMVVVIGIISFAGGLFLLQSVPQESFPDFVRNQFAVEVYLPVGSSLQQTDNVMRAIEDSLLLDPRIEEVAAFVGTSSPRFNTLYAPQIPASYYGQFVVLTKTSQGANDVINEYSRRMCDSFPGARVQWKQLRMAVSEAPIEIRISGDNIPELKQAGREVADIFRNIEGAQWVRTDFKEAQQAVQLDLKQDAASRLGFSKTFLDLSLMLGTKGFPVSTVWEGDYPVAVNLRVNERTKTSTDQVMNQYVSSQFGLSAVPLRQIVDAGPAWSEGQIAHRNGIRTLTVMVDIAQGQHASEILSKARKSINAVELPDGLSIGYGGDYESSVEDIAPLYSSLAVTVAITFLILLVQFQSIRTALIIMVTMPLSVFGAALGLKLTAYSFSVTALVGLISLIGIVVRNGIIYVSYAEELRHKHGYSLEEAAISAAKRRMRPIFLTASAAAVGVIPMILSGSTLWGPLGTVICFGLMFSLVLSLFVLPVLYRLIQSADSDNTLEREL
jgi:multidrug efflux pump subunit AcrB